MHGNLITQQAIARLIDTAAALLHMHDFNGAAMVVSGLSSVAVNRLKLTWQVSTWSCAAATPSTQPAQQMVPDEHTDSFREMTELLSAKKNFIRYRQAYKEAAYPKIPFMGTGAVVQ